MAQKGGGKTKYVGETDQGGYIVGVDVDRGDRQRSKSFSLEPSGDTSYSRSVTTPKGSRTKSIDIVDGEAIKTITRTRNGETTERTKTLSDRKADRLGERYAKKLIEFLQTHFQKCLILTKESLLLNMNKAVRLLHQILDLMV